MRITEASETDEPLRTNLTDKGQHAEQDWLALNDAVFALGAADRTSSRALYRVAIGVVAARADAYAKAIRILAEALGE